MNIAATRYVTFPELQTILGGRGRSTIYRDIENNRLPKPFKIGSRLYWDEAAIHAAIQSHTT